ncbi:Undecaprenyl-phosphate 4-deoxy-4-formamido-L-arabinose transferase [Rosistilla ulvae]|uniref:Undecaprenyl-phosphate 4-deoxy-4-formamido-L-arabinose transferase n=1 Tax=Rosistilla ulvae TaxID=1930277 RepID=A0A517M3D5_9BACT|nr:glycosyltransferase family 2 protein [Rosistilla ulvae]QDS89380.1 Undecaprenyl-phosphate 4-deoxy-4-formamido-L-arabinose transferase [Rosistilla ulvae]
MTQPTPPAAAAESISFVIPVCNEEDSLDELHAAISEVVQENGYDTEMIFIDDGSTDASWQKVQGLAARDPRVQGLRFRTNYGKAAGLAAGFDAARGTFIITMDGDLQDDPKEIPRFLQRLHEGFDVVSGWKQVRHDPWHKVLPSRVFNWMVGALTGVRIHDHNCGFKAYRREVFDEVKLYGELHRFVPVLAAAKGWRVSEIAVEHHARKYGHSKYGVRRLVKGFLDLATVYFLTGYSQRPLHLMGTTGILSTLLGLAGLVWLSISWVFTRLNDLPEDDMHLHTRAIFYFCIMAFLVGTQLMIAGLLAELLTATSRREVQPYSIAERTEASTDV